MLPLSGKEGCAESCGEVEDEASGAGVPGTERVWVKTFGCSHNFSDGEYMAGQLQAYGYRCAIYTLYPIPFKVQVGYRFACDYVASPAVPAPHERF